VFKELSGRFVRLKISYICKAASPVEKELGNGAISASEEGFAAVNQTIL